MAMGRPKAPLVLGDEQRATLEGWSRRTASANGLARRARIVLVSATGSSNLAVAERVGVSPQTVGKWRRRFIEAGVGGLLDEPRPGAPRTVSDEDVERVIVATLESAPADASHWSTRSMAAHTGLSASTIRRIWGAFSLQPHRTETWKLSKDPLFIDKVRDVVGLYLDPPERALARAGSTGRCIAATAPASSGRSSGTWTPRSPMTWRCTWSSTTTPPTRPRRSAAGWPPIRALCSTSRQPAPPG